LKAVVGRAAEEGGVELVWVAAWEQTGSMMDWQAEGARRRLPVEVGTEIDRLVVVRWYA